MELCFQGQPFKFTIRIIEEQIKEITFYHLVFLLKLKFHSYSKFRNTSHKLHMQISSCNLWAIKNEMCVWHHVKRGEFQNVPLYQKHVSSAHALNWDYSFPNQ